ncbi:unnamed protein product [Anisakis simplex]|uniref:Uncharacterized protein n=1 Tax=Anisakis simplex TaxID=6269 RepID=A0A0M3JMX7_ANISI|nr:unnamed protein product [Anisakis simplex]
MATRVKTWTEEIVARRQHSAMVSMTRNIREWNNFYLNMSPFTFGRSAHLTVILLNNTYGARGQADSFVAIRELWLILWVVLLNVRHLG